MTQSAAPLYEADRSKIDLLLSSYPRKRPPLSPAHQAIFVEQYRINREGASPVNSLAQRLERWMHRKVAAIDGAPVLEIGAGTLNHLPFERGQDPYDIVEPLQDLYEGKPALARVRDRFGSVQEIGDGRAYARIISVAVLEHLTNLPADIARSALLLERGGIFQAGIPSESGFLWGFGWRLSTGLSYRLRTGLDYGAVMRHEHVSTSAEIAAVVRHFFEKVEIQRFPTPLHHLSFYAYIEARTPRRARAEAFLRDHRDK